MQRFLTLSLNEPHFFLKQKNKDKSFWCIRWHVDIILRLDGWGGTLIVIADACLLDVCMGQVRGRRRWCCFRDDCAALPRRRATWECPAAPAQGHGLRGPPRAARLRPWVRVSDVVAFYPEADALQDLIQESRGETLKSNVGATDATETETKTSLAAKRTPKPILPRNLWYPWKPSHPPNSTFNLFHLALSSEILQHFRKIPHILVHYSHFSCSG